MYIFARYPARLDASLAHISESGAGFRDQDMRKNKGLKRRARIWGIAARFSRAGMPTHRS